MLMMKKRRKKRKRKRSGRGKQVYHRSEGSHGGEYTVKESTSAGIGAGHHHSKTLQH